MAPPLSNIQELVDPKVNPNMNLVHASVERSKESNSPAAFIRIIFG
jgi:hypothetical protein